MDGTNQTSGFSGYEHAMRWRLDIKAAREALEMLRKALPAGQFPNVHGVARTNLCVIGVAAKGPNTVIVSVLDNLVKGAAGQAVQNLNLMFGYEPTAGL